MIGKNNRVANDLEFLNKRVEYGYKFVNQNSEYFFGKYYEGVNCQTYWEQDLKLYNAHNEKGSKGTTPIIKKAVNNYGIYLKMNRGINDYSTLAYYKGIYQEWLEKGVDRVKVVIDTFRDFVV